MKKLLLISLCLFSSVCFAQSTVQCADVSSKTYMQNLSLLDYDFGLMGANAQAQECLPKAKRGLILLPNKPALEFTSDLCDVVRKDTAIDLLLSTTFEDIQTVLRPEIAPAAYSFLKSIGIILKELDRENADKPFYVSLAEKEKRAFITDAYLKEVFFKYKKVSYLSNSKKSDLIEPFDYGFKVAQGLDTFIDNAVLLDDAFAQIGEASLIPATKNWLISILANKDCTFEVTQERLLIAD